MENEVKTEEPQPSSPNPKAQTAETKLKEISKRAKQKGKISESKKESKSPLFNPLVLLRDGNCRCNWYSYLIFRTPTKTEYKFVPANTLRNRSSAPHKVELSTIPEAEEPQTSKTRQDKATKFELNCF